MNKTKKIIIGIVGFLLLIFCIYKIINFIQIKFAKREVELSIDKVDVYQKVKLGDIIAKINGKLVDNNHINTNTLGVKKVKFRYINDDNLLLDHFVNIKVEDREKPLITTKGSIDVKVGNTDFYKNIFCGDNYDDKVLCEIKGFYDINRIDSYNVLFTAKDSSGNENSKNITINVVDKIKPSKKKDNDYILLKDIIRDHKRDNTKIGLDLSYWQKDIDFQKIKEQNIEFVMLRLGRQKGIGLEYVMDDKFIEYINGFKNVGIDIGVYFFSYAHSNEEALKQARWVLDKIKDYDIKMPVVFDWENWHFYREFNLSFHSLSQMANTFLNEIKKHSYDVMHYSSKYYLENVWNNIEHDIWLAHYTSKTNYNGKYKMWQLTEKGKVEGINTLVDVNVLYN